jgi:hypothetical protein
MIRITDPAAVKQTSNELMNINRSALRTPVVLIPAVSVCINGNNALTIADF